MLLGSVGKQDDVDGKPKVQGVFRPTPTGETVDEVATDFESLPVIVETIRFENGNQVIPLNWKLSKEQKRWYIEAWKKFRDENETLNSTLKKLFTPIK